MRDPSYARSDIPAALRAAMEAEVNEGGYMIELGPVSDFYANRIRADRARAMAAALRYVSIPGHSVANYHHLADALERWEARDA